MIHPNPAALHFFRCPRAFTLEPYQALKMHQVLKVGAVAAACLVVIGIQLSYSWPLAAAVALTCSIITLVSEIFLRNDNNQNNINWGNEPINPRRLMIHIALRLSVVPLVLGLMTAFGIMPLQAVAIQIMSGNIKLILLATLIAPIAEEIIFRGFIQERLEDLATLIDRYIQPLSHESKKLFSAVAQAVLFGAVHITGKQVINHSMKIAVFCMTTLFAYTLTMLKETDQSLLSPIAFHCAHNTGIVLGLLGGRHLKSLLKPI